MDILFASKNLERLCHDDDLATRTLGRICAQKLRARLDDLRAAANLGYAAKIPGRFRPVAGNRVDRYALNLYGNDLLVIRPVQGHEATEVDKPLSLATITTIRVMRIGSPE